MLNSKKGPGNLSFYLKRSTGKLTIFKVVGIKSDYNFTVSFVFCFRVHIVFFFLIWLIKMLKFKGRFRTLF